jgi:hypothetical protein
VLPTTSAAKRCSRRHRRAPAVARGSVAVPGLYEFLHLHMTIHHGTGAAHVMGHLQFSSLLLYAKASPSAHGSNRLHSPDQIFVLLSNDSKTAFFYWKLQICNRLCGSAKGPQLVLFSNGAYKENRDFFSSMILSRTQHDEQIPQHSKNGVRMALLDSSESFHFSCVKIAEIAMRRHGHAAGTT